MPKHPGGRPPRYNAAIHPDFAKALSSLGRTDAQIAEALKIVISTFYKWQKDHPEFSDALKAGKEEPDDQVERSLFERATGYEHEDEKIFLGKDDNPVIVKTTKHYPPDATSMIYWLKNRRPKQWRDKQEIAITDADGNGLPIVQLVMQSNGRGPDDDGNKKTDN